MTHVKTVANIRFPDLYMWDNFLENASLLKVVENLLACPWEWDSHENCPMGWDGTSIDRVTKP